MSVHIPTSHLVRVFSVLALGLLMACGSDTDGSEAESVFDGTWVGQYQSMEETGLGGQLTLMMSLQDGALIGDAMFTDATCISSVSLVGEVDVDTFRISLSDAADESREWLLVGRVYPGSGTLEGGFDVESWGECTSDSGFFWATRVVE